MVLWDVNLLLHSAMLVSPHHDRCRLLMHTCIDGDEGFSVSELILSAVVRISTNPRVYDPPASREEIFEFCQFLLGHPRIVKVAPGPRHWRIFQDLVEATEVGGGDVTDAYLAALAMEHGCEFWSADHGFARFPGLRWHNPLQSAGSVHDG